MKATDGSKMGPLPFQREREDNTPPAKQRKVKPKAGERWTPKAGGPGGFMVVDVTTEGLEVEVERQVVKDGTTVAETRSRSVAWNDLPAFLLGYQRRLK